jgi:methyl-accepting chemotaxis protein
MLHPPVDPNAEPIPTIMAGSTRGDAHAGLAGRFLGRRRSYLIDSAYQVKTAIVAVLGMVFLLAFAAVLFHLVGMESALGRGGVRGGGDARTVLYLVAAGIVFVAAVFVIEILETHKTAGVVLKVTRGMKDLEAGMWSTRVSLRKNDNFRELEEQFNALARGLRDRVEDDLSGLQAIEAQVRLAAREFEGGNREGGMVVLRQVMGDVQTTRERKRNLLRAPDRTRDSAPYMPGV